MEPSQPILGLWMLRAHPAQLRSVDTHSYNPRSQDFIYECMKSWGQAIRYSNKPTNDFIWVCNFLPTGCLDIRMWNPGVQGEAWDT